MKHLFTLTLVVAVAAAAAAVAPHAGNAHAETVWTPTQCIPTGTGRYQWGSCTYTEATKEAVFTWRDVAIYSRAGPWVGCSGYVEICDGYGQAGLYGLDLHVPGAAWVLHYHKTFGFPNFQQTGYDWHPLYDFSNRHHFTDELPAVLTFSYLIKYTFNQYSLRCGPWQYHMTFQNTSSQGVGGAC
jgi:hypothetical protein